MESKTRKRLRDRLDYLSLILRLDNEVVWLTGRQRNLANQMKDLVNRQKKLRELQMDTDRMLAEAGYKLAKYSLQGH